MSSSPVTGFVAELIAITGQDPAMCYQCGKCSAGCPVRAHADTPPNRVVRYVQLGLFDKAMTSKSPWLCAGCQTCTSRCPQSFDLARFMDAVRELARHRGLAAADSATAKFHTAFLNQIRNHGRAYEVGLVRDYKLSTFDLFQDVDVAPSMFLKGKLALFPHRVKNRETLRRIFRRTEEES